MSLFDFFKSQQREMRGADNDDDDEYNRETLRCRREYEEYVSKSKKTPAELREELEANMALAQDCPLQVNWLLLLLTRMKLYICTACSTSNRRGSPRDARDKSGLDPPLPRSSDSLSG